MRSSLIIFAVISFLPLAAFEASTAQASSFTAADIRSQIIGRTIYLAAPFGGEFPLNYRSGGQVDGDGTATGFVGRMAQPKDTGRWWIDGNRLCQQFREWYNGSPMCFDLTRTGSNTLRWVRDNGESGRARIGGAL